MDIEPTIASDVDVAVLGGGTGGYSAALRAAQLGKRVALIDRGERLGGTCLLRGCIPTKALLRSGEVLDEISRSRTWGIEATGTPDWPAILSFQGKVVDKLVKGLEHLVEQRGIERIVGHGRLTSVGARPAIQIDGRTLAADHVVLALGSRPNVLPDIQLGPRVVTSDQALTLDFLPRSAVVIGGGAIGLEFASFYRSMGAEVTIIEALERIAAGEDEDVSAQLARAFRRRKITVKAGASVKQVAADAEGVHVRYASGAGGGAGEDETIEADLCLVAVGRLPVSEDAGLDDAGVATERGFIKVNGELGTSLPHVWAVGDAAATPLQYAHVAFAEGIAVAERIAGVEPAPAPIDYDGVARVTFCTPEVASVGLTETIARERGFEVSASTFNLQGLGKANILGEQGITKLVADAADGRILGVHMVGPHATDLISEGMLITNWEATAAEVAALIHPHPTLGEAIGEAALALAGKPLHG